MSEAQGMKTYQRILNSCRIAGRIAADTRGQHLVGPKFAVDSYIDRMYGDHVVTKAPTRTRKKAVDKVAVSSAELTGNQREALLRLKLEKEKIAKIAAPVSCPVADIPSASGFPF